LKITYFVILWPENPAYHFKKQAAINQEENSQDEESYFCDNVAIVDDHGCLRATG
jgi:hypothetical protein